MPVLLPNGKRYATFITDQLVICLAWVRETMLSEMHPDKGYQLWHLLHLSRSSGQDGRKKQADCLRSLRLSRLFMIYTIKANAHTLVQGRRKCARESALPDISFGGGIAYVCVVVMPQTSTTPQHRTSRACHPCQVSHSLCTMGNYFSIAAYTDPD
jgi:hypothetical protein